MSEEKTEEESIEDSDVKMEEETDNNSDYVNEEESNYNEDRKFVNRENTSDDETITLGRQIREQQRLLGNTTKPISSSNRRSSLSSNHSTELGKSSSKRSSAQPESESKRARNNNVEDEHDETHPGKPERPVRLSARRGQPSCQSCTEALTPSELENNEAQLCKKCMTRYGHHHFRCTACQYIPTMLELKTLSDPKAVTSMKSRTKNLRKPGDIVARVAPPHITTWKKYDKEGKEDENIGEGNHDDENKEEEGKVKEESNDASTQVEDESHIRNNPITISSNETNPSSSDDSTNDDEKDANNDSNPDDSNTNMEYTSSPTESNFTANASTGSMSGNNTLHSDAMEPESTSQYDEQELLDNNDDGGEDNEISGNSLHKSNITNAYTESSTSSEVIVPMENNHNNCNNTTRRSRQRECDSCPTKLSSTIGRAIDNLLLCNDCYERYRGHFSRCTACSYIPTTMELLKKFCTRCHGGTWLVVIQPVSISSNDNNSNNNTASANNTTQSQDGDKSNSSKTSTTKRRRRSTKFIFVNNTITRPITSYFDKVPAPIERPLEVGCNGDTMETELPGSDKEMITSTDCH
ncbi:hypothetical protein BDF22DRAFT_698868 [Syncephalis plumigaleata]|nr:hypothetical protein BDF22DRAFT_698868 [Syncephalis plumigaleata]